MLLDHAVHRLARIEPVPHQHNVVIGIDPDDVTSIADGGEARRRTARPVLLFWGSATTDIRSRAPCTEGVVACWIHLSETTCLPSQLPLLRISSPKRARSCEFDPQPAAPTRAAAHRLHRLPIDLNGRLWPIPLPLPFVAGKTVNVKLSPQQRRKRAAPLDLRIPEEGERDSGVNMKSVPG